MLETPHVGIALLAGLLSFFSLCVGSCSRVFRYPDGQRHRAGGDKRSLWVTLLFVLGFSVVFMLLGTAFSWLANLCGPTAGYLAGFWVLLLCFWFAPNGIAQVGPIVLGKPAVVAESGLALLSRY